MHTKIKPFTKLEMSPVERRKVLCSITFHAVALTCVVWSLYVLIERTAEEVRAGALEWPFWTKLIVVARLQPHCLRAERARRPPFAPPPGASPDEDEFHSCQSGSDNGSAHEATPEADLPPDVTGSRGSSLTPVSDPDILSEVVVVPLQDNPPPSDPPPRDNSILSNHHPQQTAS